MARQAGRRASLTPEGGAGLGAAFVVLLVVAGIEFSNGSNTSIVGWFAIAPYLAAAFTPWRYVVGVGVVASGLAWAVAFLDPAGYTSVATAQIIAMVIATGGAIAVSIFRQEQNVRFAELSKLATVTQEAVLSPLGPRVGRLAVAGRYVSASAAADIGGDLYEALDTPYGIRMIIGDVKGKGIEAVRLANMVLGAYRHAALERADLREVVPDLDRAVTHWALSEEDFVTAALVEERGGTLTVVTCGHPAPLLLRAGTVVSLDPAVTAPPLGFGTRVTQSRVEHLEPGDRLLLFTDGLSEARRGGEFFPTAERAWALLGHGTVEHGLSSLESALVEWVRGQFDDDIALLLLEYTGAAPEADPTVPSWELGSVPRPS